jgi:PAS domain S-box-containing protein
MSSGKPPGDRQPEFAEVVEWLPDAVLAIGPDGTALEYVSSAFEPVTGIPRECLIEFWPTAWIERYVHMEDRGAVAAHLFPDPERVAAGYPREMEFRLTGVDVHGAPAADAPWRWINSRVWPRTAPGDVPAGTFCVLRDVSTEKHALAALLEVDIKHTALFEALPQAVLVYDRESGRILDANPSALRCYGYTRDEIRGLRMHDLEAPRARADGRLATILVSGPGAGKPRARRHATKAGLVFPAEVHLGATRCEGRSAMLAIVVDSSERERAEQEFAKLHEAIMEKGRELEATLDHLRRAQQQLVQAQKMEAIGQLAGGVAHAFNNLLTVVIGTLDLISGELPRDSPLQQNVAAAQNAAVKAADLARRLLLFSDQRPSWTQTFDVREVVATAVDLLRRTLPEAIAVRSRIGNAAPPVHGDATRLENAILNLGINARDSMPEGGVLEVELDSVAVDAALAAAQPETPPGLYVRIVVRDTGHGLDPQTRARIFEPFFTANEPRRPDAGLGLSTVYATVRAQGGHITVDSEEGKGSTFTVFLPAAGDSKPPVTEARTARGRGELILVVDDDPAVLQTTERSLTSLGYRVVSADSGAAALELLRQHPETISLVLLDIVMPQMGGLPTLRRMREARPGLPAVLMTGFAGRGFLPPVDLDVEILPKPLDLARLAAALRQAAEYRAGK